MKKIGLIVLGIVMLLMGVAAGPWFVLVMVGSIGSLLSLVFSIYYLVKKDTAKTKRALSFIGLSLVLFILGAALAPEKEESKALPDTGTSISTTETVKASTSEIEEEVKLQVEKQLLETDGEGNVAIKGRTAPNSSVQLITETAVMDGQSDGEGYFELNYNLPSEKGSLLTVRVKTDEGEISQQIQVQPSAAFTALLSDREAARIAEQERLAAEKAEAERIAAEQEAARLEAETAAANAEEETLQETQYVDENGNGTIKGSKNGIYHIPGSRYYDQTTNPAAWFKTVSEAEAAGYRAPKN